MARLTMSVMRDTQNFELLDNYRQIYCEQLDEHSDTHILFKNINSLKIIYLNIRSYYKNIDSFLIFIESISVRFDVMVLSEAWVDEDKTLVTLDGYDVYSTTNNWNRNDGVIVYIRTELCGIMQQIALGEASGLRLDFDTDGRHYSLLGVYRSPAMDCDLFLSALDNYYSRTDNKTTYIFTGDTNINTLQDLKDNQTDIYLNILYQHGFTECITKPTRVTEYTSTCIDHIFIKHIDYGDVVAGVLITDLTDHYAVLAGVGRGVPQTPTHPTCNTYLDYKHLQTLLETQSWDHVLSLRDVNECCEAFINTVTLLKDNSLKPTNTTTRNKKLKPWITLDLVRDIRKREKFTNR